MNKILSLSFLIGCLLLASCNTATPEDYFGRAVLNSNMMSGFAGEGLNRELDQPSAKLKEGTKDQTEPMKRKEVMDQKIMFIEEEYEKVKKLKKTDETKDMLESSLALFEYVLPVYKNEYQDLAKLYDGGASKEQIQSVSQSIHDKYFSGFETRYNKLISTGKLYADKHNIKVNFVNTSPQ